MKLRNSRFLLTSRYYYCQSILVFIILIAVGTFAQSLDTEPGLLWSATKDKHSVYIFATYHGGSRPYMALPKNVKRIAEQVPVIAFESIAYPGYVKKTRTEIEDDEVEKKWRELESRNLLTQEVKNRLIATTTDGLAAQLYQELIQKYYQPSAIEKFSPSESSELDILKIAIDGKKDITSLQNPDFTEKIWIQKCGNEHRLHIINSVIASLSNQDYLLKSIELQKAVFDGNIDEFKRLVNAEIQKYPHMKYEFECSIEPRNSAWLNAIKAISEKSPALVVIGAGHVHGDASILQILKDAGFNLNQIK
jgi:uncharacterized protein YbaP (TraB family)